MNLNFVAINWHMDKLGTSNTNKLFQHKENIKTGFPFIYSYKSLNLSTCKKIISRCAKLLNNTQDYLIFSTKTKNGFFCILILIILTFWIGFGGIKGFSL